MSSEDRSPHKLYALARAAERLASPDGEWGQRARGLLVSQTGLSAEGVEYALGECLEVRTPRATWSQLVRRAPRAPRAHVILSANVFTGAFRAIALALAQTSEVFVKPSRREPILAELLYQASSGAFELVGEISPAPGDHVWVYGSDSTVQELREQLPQGVHLHAHGSGMGAAVVREPEKWGTPALHQAADLLAQDVIAFDQKGCLSPRILLLEGSDEFAERFLSQLSASMTGWQEAVPRGELSSDEQADAQRYRLTMDYVARCFDFPDGLIALDPEWERLVIPPVGRHLHVTRTADPLARLAELSSRLTSVGFFHGAELIGQCVEKLGPKRYVDLGQMQRPPMDGPVDLRTGWAFETL